MAVSVVVFGIIIIIFFFTKIMKSIVLQIGSLLQERDRLEALCRLASLGRR